MSQKKKENATFPAFMFKREGEFL